MRELLVDVELGEKEEKRQNMVLIKLKRHAKVFIKELDNYKMMVFERFELKTSKFDIEKEVFRPMMIQ